MLEMVIDVPGEVMPVPTKMVRDGLLVVFRIAAVQVAPKPDTEIVVLVPPEVTARTTTSPTFAVAPRVMT
jgi:hypothetical protein